MCPKTIIALKYLEFTFHVTPHSEAAEDVLAAVLAEIGFESFVHTDSLDLPCVATRDGFPEAPVFAAAAADGVFKGYVPASAFVQADFDAALAAFPLPEVRIAYERTEAEDKDWNAEWERNYFQPLLVGDAAQPDCVIASTFHHDVPRGRYNILIDPRMSFGTGHHATTAQMITRLLTDDFTGREVLDMGCGTSILAILARMRGAAHCVAIDVDEWCVANSRDNIALNALDGIDVRLGDANTLADYGAEAFDLIIANINRNILLRDMPCYVPALRGGGTLLLSGFYHVDVPRLRAACEQHGLTFVDELTRDDWACLKFVK